MVDSSDLGAERGDTVQGTDLTEPSTAMVAACIMAMYRASKGDFDATPNEAAEICRAVLAAARKPWEKTSWTCARASVTPAGLNCPATNRCRDCPAPDAKEAAPVATDAKPTAWLPECGSPTTDPDVAASWQKHGGKVTPLYTAPPAASPRVVEVELLTRADISAEGWLTPLTFGDSALVNVTCRAFLRKNAPAFAAAGVALKVKE